MPALSWWPREILDGAALRMLVYGDDARQVTARFRPAGRDEADAVGGAEGIAERYREAARALASAVDQADPGAHAPDESRADVASLRGAVPLVGGWLPGSAVVNTAASRQRTARRTRMAMSVSTRVAIQLAVALALAVTLGHLVSPAHLLWAVIAVYVTFLGSTSDREQLRKAAFRVAGTLIGVVVGDGLAHLTGTSTVPVLVVITLAAFFMLYFGRVNYALVVLAATIGVTQFYTQAGELTNALLATRVEETALGAACAILVGFAVLPLRTAYAAELALGGYLRALAQVLDGLAKPTFSTNGHGARTATRLLDSGFHTAVATLRPLTRTLLGTINRRCTRVLQLVDLSHELGRTVVHDSAAARRTDGDLTELAGITSRAACTARAVADDLERSPSSRVLRSIPAQTTQRHDSATPATTSLRTEIEDIEAAITELAEIRGLETPYASTSADDGSWQRARSAVGTLDSTIHPGPPIAGQLDASG